MNEVLSREEWNALSPEEQYTYALTLGALIAERDRLVEAIPECPLHGACVNHAIEWVQRMQGFPTGRVEPWCCQEPDAT